MEKSMSRHRKQSSRGFTVIETLFAMVVLTVGLVALSSLAATTLNNTERSRFMGMAANLASEKLEDLNRYPTADCNVVVASASTYGSLTADSTQAVSCNSGSTTVDYYDDVDVTDNSGAISETTETGSGSGLTYTTTKHTPDGLLNANGTMITSSSTATAAGTGAVDFHRRWTIEMDQPITGIRRITVLVTLVNGFMSPPVSYQMTMVRP
jgi:Tfp pilus assembly protein PilV